MTRVAPIICSLVLGTSGTALGSPRQAASGTKSCAARQVARAPHPSPQRLAANDPFAAVREHIHRLSGDELPTADQIGAAVNALRQAASMSTHPAEREHEARLRAIAETTFNGYVAETHAGDTATLSRRVEEAGRLYLFARDLQADHADRERDRALNRQMGSVFRELVDARMAELRGLSAYARQHPAWTIQTVDQHRAVIEADVRRYVRLGLNEPFVNLEAEVTAVKQAAVQGLFANAQITVSLGSSAVTFGGSGR